jgi:hypothetical protein
MPTMNGESGARTGSEPEVINQSQDEKHQTELSLEIQNLENLVRIVKVETVNNTGGLGLL